MELLERDDALAALDEARKAATAGHGRIVLVSGEAGVGKSAVVDTFVHGLGSETRVLCGTCDDLATPRPLAPLRDFVGLATPFAEALRAGEAHEIHSLFLEELEQSPIPTVVVFEDVHWADDATLDAITYLARRIASLPAALVLTFRSGEAPPGHPLHATLGSLPPASTSFHELKPLSASAVDQLVGGDGGDVYRATRGNPFYVTELLARESGRDLPPSVATSVLGRAARLGAAERELLELVSVVPARMPIALLDRLVPDWALVAEEPERRRLLEVAPAFVRFRHELARQAVVASLPIASRRRYHEGVLDVLLDSDADAAEIVHHAAAAGRADVLAEHAVVAARRATALESNREAYAQYRRVTEAIDHLPAEQHADVLAEFGTAAYVVGRTDEAIPAMDRAILLHNEVGDVEAAGRCTRMLARLHWFAGHGDEAREAASAAIDLLETLGPSVELARAYGARAQLAMLAEDQDEALEWGTRALELATALGDDAARAYVLVTIGTVAIQLDSDDSARLLDAHRAADAAGDPEEATRALTNLGFTQFYWACPDPARDHLERALAYARRHERENMADYAATTLAWMSLRQGEWDEAERIARAQSSKGRTVPQLLASTVLTELALRRGDADAGERLVALAAQAEQAGDMQRVCPVLELEIEHALTGGGPMPHERLERLTAKLRSRSPRRDWALARIAAWSTVAGVPFGKPLGPAFEGPLAAMADGDWSKAADAYGRFGWDYDRALMLSLLDTEGALTSALELARSLNAVPLERRVATRMKSLRLAVPRGPRISTRANPAGLTARQLEVLKLLLDGLTNTEIADNLVVSPRTAEHHVAAVLEKLGAASRRDAMRRANELGLQ